MSLTKLLALLTNQRIIFPFYHAVSDLSPVHLKHLYKVRSVGKFSNDLDFLLKHYTPVSIHDVYDHLKGFRKLPTNAFFISFDDGLSEFKQFAWPVLKQKGIPVALFVNPGFIDNDELFFRFKASILIEHIRTNKKSKLLSDATDLLGSMVNSVNDLESFVRGINYPQQAFLNNLAEYFQIDFAAYKKEYKPYLTKYELVTLKQEGVFIGAHSMDHPLFHQLPEMEQINQLLTSVNWVKSTLNPEISSFSFPFTDFGMPAIFWNKIADKVDITWGTAGMKNEQIKSHLQRIPIEDYYASMDVILRNQYFYYLLKAPFFKNTIRR